MPAALLFLLLCPALTLPHPCTPIHSKSYGVTVVCCSKTAQLPDNCEYASPLWCYSDHCRCYLSVDTESLRCLDSNSSTFEWRDHDVMPREPFSCLLPNFPNKRAEFSLDVLFAGENELFDKFLDSLQRYKIVEFDANLRTDGFEFRNPNFYFPELRFLQIRGNSQNVRLISGENLAKLEKLEVLTVRGVQNMTTGSIFSAQEAAYCENLLRIQIEHCPFVLELPNWLKTCSQLRYLRIKQTGVTNVTVLSHLHHLQNLYLPQNLINSLQGVSFSGPNLREIDLSRNQIPQLHPENFGELPQLYFLDLSHNPIQTLPERIFSTLINLKWLYLRNTKLTTFGASNSIGLASLKHLSLEGNPEVYLEPFSLLPLTALETLDLRKCNLTVIPDAVTQACELRHLWLNFNLIYSEASLPPEILTQLRELTQLNFGQNPLFANPASLYLLPKSNMELVESVVSSLKLLPLWFNDRCVPYYWWTHLVNRSESAKTQQFYGKLLPDSVITKLGRRQKQQCELKYLQDLEEMSIYRNLVINTRCESERRFRSLGSAPELTTSSQLTTESNILVEKAEPSGPNFRLVLLVSLLLNSALILFLFLYVVALLTRRFCLASDDGSTRDGSAVIVQ